MYVPVWVRQSIGTESEIRKRRFLSGNLLLNPQYRASRSSGITMTEDLYLSRKIETMGIDKRKMSDRSL